MTGNFAQLPTELLATIAESSGESTCWIFWLHDSAFKQTFEPLRFHDALISRSDTWAKCHKFYNDTVITSSETTYLFDQLHSVNGLPAISIKMITAGVPAKYNVWCYRGNIHRVGHPAIVSFSPVSLEHGLPNKYNDGQIGIWDLAFKFIERAGKMWIHHGVPHRVGGPAIISAGGEYRAVNGRFRV